VAHVLGSTDTSAAEVIAAARSIITGLRSKPLMTLLDDAVADGPHLRSPVAGSAGSAGSAGATSGATRSTGETVPAAHEPATEASAQG